MTRREENLELLAPGDSFARRHIGPQDDEVARMLATLGLSSLDQLIDQTVPASIRMQGTLDLPAAASETGLLAGLREIAGQNQAWRTYLGMGYSGCLTPPVILRNVLENPGWYTQYTAYQSEIAQGRLEALLNFQTVVTDLTGMEVANASLLDEGTAAAESMTLCHRVQPRTKAKAFFVDQHCHPQTIEVVQGRAAPLGFEVVVGDPDEFDFSTSCFGALVQYPRTDGEVVDLEPFCARAHENDALVVVAADLLALTLLRPPGEFGADVVVGSAQRFGVPMGYGGPHAAFMSSRAEYQRKLPGRIAGVSRDARGRPGIRLALQTREQHIRRDRATSNICTAQVLLAVVASMYAVYHGPGGLRRIARRVHLMARLLARGLADAGHTVRHSCFFDTVRVGPAAPGRDEVLAAARARRINLREFADGDLGVALDETTDVADVQDLLEVFGAGPGSLAAAEVAATLDLTPPAPHARQSDYLQEAVFQRFHTETELLRYLTRLQSRDLSLTTSMTPLGSCTMKLNATAEMIPVTWPGFADLHPFVPAEQAAGYARLHDDLERWLAEITGFARISLQPNAGSQGEYAGLLVIRAYHQQRGEGGRNVCLIPTSAHGTNPASAVLAGMKVVPVKCDQDGNIDLEDLERRAAQHQDDLAALMVTYPSTHGVFEEGIREVCRIVHDHGGRVYLDGANMNAMVGLCQPGKIGADVCHLNLHKTFCIPHGGGGPGMGPIGVVEDLAPFLPGHPLADVGGEQAIRAVSAAPWGSPMVLPISHAYIAMMGAAGLTRATQVAILNANYIAHRLEEHFPVLYRGRNGRVAHECIVDLRPVTKKTGVDVEDVAKRLMDYGFHAPTVSFPVAGTLMIEPTESESLEELDRFCEALIHIRQEIREIEEGRADREVNLLKGAPHTAECVADESWDRPYSRERAAFPAPWTREHKFWPVVGRVDNVYGDRNLVCCWIPEFDEVPVEA